MKNLIISTVMILFFVNSALAQSRPTTNTSSNTENTIVAGKGWSKIVLGVSKDYVDKLLGPSDIDSEYRSFHGDIGIFVSLKNDEAKEITFETSIGKYKSDMTAIPDKNLKWGCSQAEVVKAYRNSYTKRAKDEEYGGEILSGIIYKNIEFSFARDKLVRISIFNENERLNSFK